MSTAQIKQQLHDYINSSEDKKLKAIYPLIESDRPHDPALTDAQKEELDRRYTDHQTGLGLSYTWNKTVTMARAAVIDKN